MLQEASWFRQLKFRFEGSESEAIGSVRLAIKHAGNPGSVGGPTGAGYLAVKCRALVKVRFPLGNLDLLCNFVIGL